MHGVNALIAKMIVSKPFAKRLYSKEEGLKERREALEKYIEWPKMFEVLLDIPELILAESDPKERNTLFVQWVLLEFET